MQGIQIPVFGSVLLGIEMHLQLQPRPGFYAEIPKPINSCLIKNRRLFYYIGSAEGHEYPNLQVGDEVDPRLSFCVNSKSINSCFF